MTPAAIYILWMHLTIVISSTWVEEQGVHSIVATAVPVVKVAPMLRCLVVCFSASGVPVTELVTLVALPLL
jgi:hypothetical protein